MVTQSFVIVTTKNLPEAYFLAEFLLRRRQRVGILNIRGRSPSAALRTITRIGRRRGMAHLLDMLLGRIFRQRYQSSNLVPFPEIDAGAIKAIRQKVKSHDSEDPHCSSSLGFVEEFGPDYIVLAGAPVLRPSLYGLAKRGALNRHLGISPAYKGSDCVLWAMRDNDFASVGFTVHVVTGKVDGGAMLLQRTVAPRRDMSFSAFLAHLSATASHGFVEVLEGILSGAPLEGQAQVGQGIYCPPAGLTTLRRAWLNYQRFVRHERDPG